MLHLKSRGCWIFDPHLQSLLVLPSHADRLDRRAMVSPILPGVIAFLSFPVRLLTPFDLSGLTGACETTFLADRNDDGMGMSQIRQFLDGHR